MNTAHILVHSGHLIDLENLRPEDIHIQDIAHALSNVCRFGGHIPRFYSVAQHSCFVAELMPHPGRLEGLMHDAAEAYIGDMVTPIKHLPAMYGFRALEEKVQSAIAKTFGLGLSYWRDDIKRCDGLAYVTESLCFKGKVEDSMREKHGIVVDERGRMVELRCWSPEEAEAQFLRMFGEITEQGR